MRTRLALKHLSGSRANTKDTLALPPEREIILGRDPECHVRFNETDELVSRKHLKIVATDEQPVRFMAVDLGSRNGTFVNRQRVFGAALLLPGVHVQLGAGGPEFEFGLDTAPARSAPSPAPAGKRWFDKQTLSMLLLAALGVAGFAAWPQVTPKWREWRAANAAEERQARFTPAAALASVAAVGAEWRVFDKQTGVRLAPAYIANERISQNSRIPLLDGAPGKLPAFVLGPDRRMEPLLVPAGTPLAGNAVGGMWTSQGVIVSLAGDVLTAAPTPRPWDADYHWTSEETAGALLVLDATKITQVVPLTASQFPRWVPADSGFFAEQLPPDLLGDLRVRHLSRSDLRVEVTANLAESGRPVKAKLAAESSGIWLAAVSPGGAPPGLHVPLLDHGKPGQPVWVVASEIEPGEIRDATPDGLIDLRAPHCSEGGAVFDLAGRVVALCIPGARSQTGEGVAIPIRRGLALLRGAWLGGAGDGQPRQP